MEFCRLHDEHWAINLEILGSDTLSFTETCSISKHGLVVHKFKILLSIVDGGGGGGGEHESNTSYLTVIHLSALMSSQSSTWKMTTQIKLGIT